MNAPPQPSRANHAEPPGLGRVRRLVELLALAWALLLALALAGRIAFPLELEWMEGGSLHHALRLARGEAIYAAPSIDFVPFLYTPLYPALLAGLAGLGLPLGLVLGRALSVAAVVAVAAGLWRLCADEGKPRAHRAAAVGLYLAGYVFAFRWYDLARADSLMLALLLWGCVLLRRAEGGGWRALVGGVLVALAFWTKQTAAVMILASGVGGLALLAGDPGWRRRLAGLAAYTLTVAALVLGGLALGDALTDGWLWTYIYELHQGHAFNHERFTRKTWGMFLHGAPALALLLAALAAWRIGDVVRCMSKRTGPLRHVISSAGAGRRFWGILALAGLLAAALGYATQWAEPNAFIPGVVFGAAYLGVALPVGGRREAAALALVALHLVFAAAIEPTYQPIQDRGVRAIGASYRWQEPRRTIPDAAARARAGALRGELAALRARDGDGAELLALQRPWWSVLAGGRGHVASMGISDVAEADRRRLQAELRAAARARRFAEIWLEGEPPPWLRAALAGEYRVLRRLRGDARVLPWSGYLSEAGMVTPYRGDQLLLGVTGERPRPAGARVLADFEVGGVDGFERRGAAFGRTSMPAISGDLPALGPHGGAALLGSARRRAGLGATGEARSAPFAGPEGAALVLLVGRSEGGREGLHLAIEAADGPSRRFELDLPPSPPWVLGELRWVIPASLAERPLRLVVSDASERGAIFIDDLWLVDAG